LSDGSHDPIAGQNQGGALELLRHSEFCKPGGKARTSAKQGKAFTTEESDALFGDEYEFGG
jgi:hypothetical protein